MFLAGVFSVLIISDGEKDEVAKSLHRRLFKKLH